MLIIQKESRKEMTYRDLTKNIANFGKEIHADIQELKTAETEFNNLVKKGELGYKQKDEKLAEMKRAIIEKQAHQKNVFQSSARIKYETKLKAIEEEQQAVTQDDLAELLLLDQIELTQDDINKYADKYANKPLAMRKINSIAKEQELTPVYHDTEVDNLNFINNKVTEYIEMFSDNSQIADPLVLNFTISSLDENINDINNLYEKGIHKTE